MIKMILAIDPNNIIGNENKLPWNIPEELKFFKKTTWGKTLFLGRKTFDSLPKGIKNREFVVLSKNNKFNNVKKVLHNLNSATLYLQNFKDDIFIVGGKKIYEDFFHLADEIFVSFIKKEYQGNLFLNIDFNNLKNYKKELIKKHQEFDVYKFTKIK